MDIKIKKPTKFIGCLILTVLIVFSVPCDAWQSHDATPVLKTPSHTANHNNGFKPGFQLTAEEKIWLKSHPIIRFSGDPAYLPLEAFSPDGKYIGIFADILDLLESRLDARFERVPVSTWSEAVRMAEAGEVDFLSESTQSGRDKLFTNPHTEIPVVIIAPKGTPTLSSPAELNGRKVAVVKGYTVHTPFREAHSEIDFVEAESTRDGLLLVTTGGVDAFISTPLTASYLMSEMGIENLSIIGYTGAIIKLGFGVRRDAPQLVSILNKALSTITEQEKLAFRVKWSANKFERFLVQLTPEERAWLKAHPVITLGGGIFPPLDDFSEVKDRPEGIGPDYTELIGDLLGIKFKHISDDWAKILKMAEDKKIDGIRIMLRNKEREGYLNFTQSQTSIQYAIFVQKQSGQLSTLKELSHKQVGLMKDTYSHSYLRERHPDIEVVPFKRIDDALFALIGGELDAVVASLTVAGIAADRLFITNLKVAATVPEMDTRLQIGVRKDWPQLVTILNKAINAITPEQHREIKRRWITFDPEDLTESLKLSEKEKAWLAQDHTVRVRVANAEPYIFVRDGKPQGIAVDLLSQISRRTGVKFHYIMSSPSFVVDLGKIARHEGPDLISTIMKTPERETFLLFTNNYSRSPRFIFTRHDSEFIRGMNDLSGKTVAVVNSFVVHKYLKKNHPEINLLVFKNVVDSLKAVSSGKAFAFIGDLKYAPMMITRLGLHNLKVAAPSSLPDHLQAMATRNDWPELRSILNKGLESIPDEEKTALINKWSTVRVEYGIRPADVLKWILMVAVVGSGIVLLFLFWNRSLSNKVKERTGALETSKKSLETEILERKHTEERLQEYQHRLKALAYQLTVAEEKERQSIATGLHDHVGHSLALARMQLDGVLESQSALETKILVKDISNILLEAQQDTRNLIFELSSPSMNEIGLGAAISEWLEDKIGKRHGLKTELISNIGDEHRKTLDENIRALLFRNVRELLTNVVKHARAQKVRVHLTEDTGELKIVIEDDGAGFDPDAENTKEGKIDGFGLFSIQERMVDIGGTFDIQSEPGKGCRVTLTVPVGKGKND